MKFKRNAAALFTIAAILFTNTASVFAESTVETEIPDVETAETVEISEADGLYNENEADTEKTEENIDLSASEYTDEAAELSTLQDMDENEDSDLSTVQDTDDNAEQTADDNSEQVTEAETETSTEFVYPPSFTVTGVFGGRNVVFKSDKEDAIIYYSSTSSTLTVDDKCAANGETVLFENFYGTIYARAYYNGSWSNVSRLILKIPVVNTPTIELSGNKAAIKSTTPSSYIYYTTDGTAPTVENGKKLGLNGGTAVVEPGSTVRAIAVRSCFTNSSTVSKYVPVMPAKFEVKGVIGGRNVTFTSETESAVIYYSSTTSSLTTSDKCVKNGETVLFENFYGTIYAKAYYNGIWSNVSRLILKIPGVNAPNMTIDGSTVTLSSTTPSSIIYYTTNGETPTTQSTKYTSPFTVSVNDRVRAIAVRSCFSNSDETEKTYIDMVLENVEKAYPEGTVFNNSNCYYWKCVNTYGYGCYGFAGIVSDSIFGVNGSSPKRHYDLSKIKQGDHVRVNNDGHSVIVAEVCDDGIIVTEGNYGGCVHWGRYISFDEITAYSYYIETRY